jgi:hypothetical protein
MILDFILKLSFFAVRYQILKLRSEVNLANPDSDNFLAQVTNWFPHRIHPVNPEIL